MAKGLIVRLVKPHKHAGLMGVTDSMEGVLVRVKIHDEWTTTAFEKDVEVVRDGK